MNWVTRLVLTGATMELFVASFGFALNGLWAGVAALVGASIATGAQVVAVALLRPAMGAAQARFQQRWAVGVAIRFMSFLALAVLLLTLREVFPPAWLAAGWLSTMLLLLYAETRFLT